MTKQKVERLNIHIREAFEAQLPIVAAILAAGYEDFDAKQAAADAVDLVVALEEELEQ